MYSKINHFFIFQNYKESNDPKTHILVSFAKMYRDHLPKRCNTNLGNWIRDFWISYANTLRTELQKHWVVLSLGASSVYGKSNIFFVAAFWVFVWTD